MGAVGDPSVLYCTSRERRLCYRLFLLTIAKLSIYAQVIILSFYKSLSICVVLDQWALLVFEQRALGVGVVLRFPLFSVRRSGSRPVLRLVLLQSAVWRSALW